MLQSIRKKLFNLKKDIDNLSDFKDNIDLEKRLKFMTSTGINKENGNHLTTGINISENEDENILVSKNITSYDRINLNNTFKIDSNIQYKFESIIKTEKGISYETPIILEKDKTPIKKLIIPEFFKINDNRTIIKDALYPDTLYNELFHKNSINYILYKDKFNYINKLSTETKTILLNDIINFSKEKGILISKDVIEYTEFMLYLNEKLSLEEIQAIESINLLNKLTKYKKYLLISNTENHKTYHILDDQYILQNNDILTVVNKNANKIQKLGENIIKKFL